MSIPINTQFEEKLTKLPEVPQRFGEDGGHFYRYYDALADEIDEDMVKSLKAQLDGILIYAGLFAGVNSAFLALTLPEMGADPADDTNALLLQLVIKDSRNITSPDDLPSASFSPASGMFSINILFSLSLTLALLAAFLAVLGQQWLVYYRKRSGGGVEAQRWEQLRRYLGAKRWRLEALLDDILPSLLQLGLVIFCIGFALYLSTLSRWICYSIAIPMGLALACIMIMAVSAALDQWCPFKSPLSRALQLVPPSVVRPAWHIILSCLSWALISPLTARDLIGRAAGPMIRRTGQATLHLRAWASAILSRARRPAVALTNFLIPKKLQKNRGSTRPDPYAWREPKYASKLVSRLAEHVPQPAEPVDLLQLVAVKRILCTSEDDAALIHAASNIQAYESPLYREWLLSDEEVYDRLWEAVKTDIYYGHKERSSNLRRLSIEALQTTFLHLVFFSKKADFLLGPHGSLQISPPTLNDTSPNYEKVIRDLEPRIETLRMVIPRYPARDLSPTLLGLLLIKFILSPHYVSRWEFDAWFKEPIFSLDATADTSRSNSLFLGYLLACGVQSFTNIAKIRSLDERPDYSKGRLRFSGREYTEWSLRTVRNIIAKFSSGEFEADEPLRDAFSTWSLDRSDRPSDRVYVSLLRHVMSWTSTRYFPFQWEQEGFLVTAAIDLSSAWIRPAAQSTLNELEIDECWRDLTDWLESLDGRLKRKFERDDLATYPEYKIARKYKEFLELTSDALKRGDDVFDNHVGQIAIRVVNVVVSSGRLQTETYQRVTEEFRKVCQEIESVLNDGGLLKRLKSLNPSNSGNPADPPTSQTSQGEAKTSDPGGDKATPESNVAIPSEETGGEEA